MNMPAHLSTKSHRQKTCFGHFKKRLKERVSDKLDPKLIWDGIISAIDRRDTEYVTFVARTNRQGRRLWRVGTEDVGFFIIFDHKLGCPVTVLPRNSNVLRTPRKGKARNIKLEALE